MRFMKDRKYEVKSWKFITMLNRFMHKTVSLNFPLPNTKNNSLFLKNKTKNLAFKIMKL
jgi:hypothetical protein